MQIRDLGRNLDPDEGGRTCFSPSLSRALKQPTPKGFPAKREARFPAFLQMPPSTPTPPQPARPRGRPQEDQASRSPRQLGAQEREDLDLAEKSMWARGLGDCAPALWAPKHRLARVAGCLRQQSAFWVRRRPSV